MLDLLLIRHAKAQPPERGEDDHARALSGIGLADAPRVGQALRAAGVRPDAVLVSSALRCRQTWDAMASDFPGADVRVTDDLYLASQDVIADLAQALDVHSVAVVAHNPGLHDLACRLMAGDEPDAASLREKMSPGAGAWFRRECIKAPWRLSLLVTARSLRA